MPRGRRRWRLGAFLLWVALLFKASAFFYAATGAAIFLWYRRREKVGRGELTSPAVLYMAGLAALYYLNYAVYVGRRGGTYLVRTPEAQFFISPARVFAREFATEYLPITILIGLAWILVRQRRPVLMSVPLVLFVLRCVSLPAGGYYTLFFVPVMAWLVSELFVWAVAERPRLAAWIVPLVVGGALVFNAAYFVDQRGLFVTRRTMRWDAVIGVIDAALPPGGEVFYRKASPKYELIERGRRDARYTYVSEDPGETERRLTTPGAKVYLAPVSDLDEAAGRRLAANGFRPLLHDLGPQRARFVLWFKAA